MTRRQKTEDRGQNFCRGIAAQSARTCRVAVHNRLSSERGFSLVSAIFLLVVIAALGIFAVTLSTTQHQSAAMDVMGSRAYQAARAGIEWAAYQVVTQASPPVTCDTNFAQGSLGGTLAPFTVTVTCTSTPVAGDLISYVYDVSAVAKAGAMGDPNYVERVIRVKMGK